MTGKKRWKGGIYNVVCAVEQERGWGEIFETETHIRLLSTCVCVCVCMCVRERERFNSPPKVRKKEPGDPNTMDLLV